jgi:hypothetical protein
VDAEDDGAVVRRAHPCIQNHSGLVAVKGGGVADHLANRLELDGTGIGQRVEGHLDVCLANCRTTKQQTYTV